MFVKSNNKGATACSSARRSAASSVPSDACVSHIGGKPGKTPLSTSGHTSP